MSHFPTPSPKPSIAFNEIINSSESRLRGKLLPTPFDNQISLFSIFASALCKKDFPIDTSALIQNGRMGLTFRQLDDMSRRIAKILASHVAQINRNLSPQSPNFQEAPSNGFGDVVVGLLTDGNYLDERILVYILSILKLGAAYVHVHREQLQSDEDWKLFVRRVQPLLVIQFDKDNQNLPVNQTPNFIPSRVIYPINTDTGKHKLPLPYFIIKSSQLWEDAVNGGTIGKPDITPLQLKTPLGQRTAMICSTFVPGNGVRWTRIGNRIIHNRIYWEKMEFFVQEGEKFYLTYPISDPRSLVELFMPLCTGKPVHILDPNLYHAQLFRNPAEDNQTLQNDKLLAEIAELAPHRLRISPQHLEDLLDFVQANEERRSDLGSIRVWLVSGGTFSLELGKKFFETLPPGHKCLLAILYGANLPEVLWAATWVSYANMREISRRCVDGKLCMGTPINNILVSIIDDKNWRECAVGGKGEVFISMHGMGTDATNFIQTGDLGRIVRDRGIFKVLVLDGKTNTRVKVQGSTIDLSDLGETIKNSVRNVEKCVVFVAPRTRDIQTVVVAYVPKISLTVHLKSCIEKSIRQIEPLVNSFLEVKEIPCLGNEQVDFRELRNLYTEYLTFYDESSSDWSIFLRDCSLSCDIQETLEQEEECAKVLCKSIATSTGRNMLYIAKKLNESFSRVTSLICDAVEGLKDTEAIKAVRTVHAIKTHGYLLSPEDFISSTTLKDLVKRMASAQTKNHVWKREVDGVKNLIRYQPLKIENWNDVINLLKLDFDSKATMFSTGSLERYWKRALDDVMKMGLSVVAFYEKTMVGCALNCSSIPRSEYVPVGMNKIFGLIQTAMDSSRAETLTRSEGNLLKSFYIAVNPEAFDNECWKVIVVRGLLEESMKLGQEINKFGSYLVCTANPLIQEVATCLLKYRPLLELPMNRYKTNNFEKPFWSKDDHEKIGVYFKPIITKKKVRPASAGSKQRVRPASAKM